MLCEVSVWGNFAVTWAVLSLMGLLFVFVMSGYLFYHYYVHATFEKWQYKSNAKYPTPEKVRDEIVMMIKGMCTATLCPALSLHLAQRGLSNVCLSKFVACDC